MQQLGSLSCISYWAVGVPFHNEIIAYGIFFEYPNNLKQLIVALGHL